MSWKNVGRVGVDQAGGVIIGPGVPTVIVNSSPITIETDSVTPHGSNPPHSSSPKLTPGGGDPVVLAGPATKQVFRKGDLATCGHPLTPGSPNVFAGTGAAASLAYIQYVESTFTRPSRAQPAASLSDAYGLLTDDDPDFHQSERATLSSEQREVLDMYNSEAAIEEDKTEPAPPPSEVPPNCASLPTTPPFSPSLRLSPNFTYGDVSLFARAGSHQITGPKTVGGKSYTAQELLCNLKTLCENVLEPMAARYGRRNMQINSGYRNNGGTSQHEKGEAVDIRFTNLPGGTGPAAQKGYYDRAVEIRSGFGYDQLILETHGNQGPWIHVSYSSDGNRRAALTTNNGVTYKSGLWLKG